MESPKDIYAKFDVSRVSHFEKLLKLIQYVARASNIPVRRKYLSNLTRSMSIVRRVLRVFNQLIVLDAISNLQKSEPVLGKRFFRYLYNLLFLIFTNLDLLILLYQMNIVRNKELMGRVFVWVDWIWIAENVAGIIDNIIVIKGLKPAEDQTRRVLAIDNLRLLFDTGFAFSFLNYQRLGETVLCTNALFSTFFGFQILK
jgi:hypothetical protein